MADAGRGGARDTPGVKEARDLVAGARTTVVLTGAGMSAEAGVPTFRGEDGLWKSHRPEELATPEAFRRDPVLVWSWYAWRQRRIAECAPHEGHRALARYTLEHPGSLLATQNVDGLHDRALAEVRGRGPDAGAPIPDRARPRTLHGSIFRLRCSSCSHRQAAEEPVSMGDDPGDLPTCPRCGSLLRPDVVWFGEPLDVAVLEEVFGHARAADVCLVVGTSAVVHPAASVPVATLEGGGAIVEVNPDETPLSRHARVSLRGKAAEVLPGIVD